MFCWHVKAERVFPRAVSDVDPPSAGFLVMTGGGGCQNAMEVQRLLNPAA